MNTATRDRLDALLRERAAQDAHFEGAKTELQTLGQTTVLVEQTSLEAIDEACLVPAHMLGPHAVRI